jgi:hypothetical protein
MNMAKWIVFGTGALVVLSILFGLAIANYDPWGLQAGSRRDDVETAYTEKLYALDISQKEIEVQEQIKREQALTDLTIRAAEQAEADRLAAERQRQAALVELVAWAALAVKHFLLLLAATALVLFWLAACVWIFTLLRQAMALPGRAAARRSAPVTAPAGWPAGKPASSPAGGAPAAAPAPEIRKVEPFEPRSSGQNGKPHPASPEEQELRKQARQVELLEIANRLHDASGKPPYAGKPYGGLPLAN